MPTYTVQLPLVPLATGQVVERVTWPAHITVIGNFRADAVRPIIEVLARFARAVPPVRAVVGGEAWFGPDRDVLVDLVDARVLRALHTQLLGQLEATITGFEVVVPAHSRSGYQPHRTVTAGPRPAHGEVLEAARLALAELNPAGRAGRALIRGTWPLKGVASEQWAP